MKKVIYGEEFAHADIAISLNDFGQWRPEFEDESCNLCTCRSVFENHNFFNHALYRHNTPDAGMEIPLLYLVDVNQGELGEPLSMDRESLKMKRHQGLITRWTLRTESKNLYGIQHPGHLNRNPNWYGYAEMEGWIEEGKRSVTFCVVRQGRRGDGIHSGTQLPGFVLVSSVIEQREAWLEEIRARIAPGNHYKIL